MIKWKNYKKKTQIFLTAKMEARIYNTEEAFFTWVLLNI